MLALVSAVSFAVSAVARSLYDLGHALVATIAPPVLRAPLLLNLIAKIQSMKAQSVTARRPVLMPRWRMCSSI